MKLVKNSSTKSKPANSNYDSSKYNAVKYGIFSKHTVMHWENKNDYDSILNDLIEEYQPNNLTERHLIVELANIIWSKMRLKYAEKASLQKELNENVNGYFSTRKAEEALLKEERTLGNFNIKNTLVITDANTKLELNKLKEYLSYCDKSIDILTETDNYKQGLSALHIDDQDKWSDTWVDDDDDGTYSPTSDDLLQWVEDCQSKYQDSIYELENKDKVKDQVLGSTFLSDEAMNKYMRYENHLDKKFEKTLAMFFKLREIRSNGGLTKSVL